MDLQVLMTMMGPAIQSLVEAYGGQFGWAVTALVYIATFRLFFKPIMAAVESAVKESASQEDDKVLAKVQGNVIYKGFIFLVDLLASIKIKPKASAAK